MGDSKRIANRLLENNHDRRRTINAGITQRKRLGAFVIRKYIPKPIKRISNTKPIMGSTSRNQYLIFSKKISLFVGI